MQIMEMIDLETMVAQVPNGYAHGVMAVG